MLRQRGEILRFRGWESLGSRGNVATTGGNPAIQRLGSSRQQEQCCDNGGKSWDSEALKTPGSRGNVVTTEGNPGFQRL